MKRYIEIHCPRTLCDWLADCIRNYADVAFPPHCVDCQQVARNALVQAAEELRTSWADGQARYNKRIRAFVKEAIRLHYRLLAAESGQATRAQCELMLELCQGVPHDERDLAAARAEDDAGPLPTA